MTRCVWPWRLSFILGLFWRTGCYILRNLFQFNTQFVKLRIVPVNAPIWALTSAKPTSWRKWSWCAIVHSQPLALWLTFTSLPSGSLIPLPSIISQAWLKFTFNQGLGLAVYHSNSALPDGVKSLALPCCLLLVYPSVSSVPFNVIPGRSSQYCTNLAQNTSCSAVSKYSFAAASRWS